MDVAVQSAIVVTVGGILSATLPAVILRATAKRDAAQLKRREAAAQRHKDLEQATLQREIERTKLRIEKLRLERELEHLQAQLDNGSEPRPFGRSGDTPTDDDDDPDLVPTLF